MAERLGIAGRFKHYQLVTMVVAAFVVVCYSPISESFDLPDKASASQRLKTIIVNNYHPYTFMNNKGEPDGFSVEIARAVAKVMDLELEIRADRWDLAIKELEAGSIDLLPMMAYTAERDKTFDFSVPHTIAFDAIFHKKGATGLGTLKELSGKTVIVMNRDIAHSYLISSGLSKSMALNLVDSLPDALQQLSVGEGDAAIMPKLVGIVTAKKLNITDIEASSHLIDAYSRSFSFAVKDGNQVLLERLNQGLNIIKSTGQYDIIYKKWFGAVEDPHLNLKTAVKYGAFAALILLVLIVWNIVLKRQVRDKTDHLEAELVHRRLNEEELIQAKNDWESTFDAVTDMITIQDRDFNIIRANHAAQKILSLPPLIQAKCFKYYHGAEKPPTDCPSCECLITGIPSTVEIFEPHLGKHLEIRAMPRVGNDGRIVSLIHVIRDITDRKLAEAEKSKLEAQLLQAQKMESVGRLAGGVAHDFNNLLTVIIGYSQIGLMELDPESPVVGYLDQIHKTADRAADLTRQLLAFARQQTIAPKVLDLNEIVSGMLKMLQRLIGEDIQLSWHPADDLWQVKLDPSQIDQILANLCVNARDSITDIGKITIETENRVVEKEYCDLHSGLAPGEYVRLAVSDDGCGMDKETLNHIYEPFFTTKGIGKGTGLGLATVYGIVKQNNGFINVYSEPGVGTTFRIYLPRHVGKAEKTSMEGAAKIPQRGQETILLVEDEPAILNITKMILIKQGYNVQEVNSPNEALRLASDHSSEIHLLITDVVMPGMNGRDLATKLQSLYPQLKTLFMSGYTANVIAHRGVLDEGVHFIQKPFSLPDLAAKVREVLDAH